MYSDTRYLGFIHVPAPTSVFSLGLISNHDSVNLGEFIAMHMSGELFGHGVKSQLSGRYRFSIVYPPFCIWVDLEPKGMGYGLVK